MENSVPNINNAYAERDTKMTNLNNNTTVATPAVETVAPATVDAAVAAPVESDAKVAAEAKVAEAEAAVTALTTKPEVETEDEAEAATITPDQEVALTKATLNHDTLRTVITSAAKRLWNTTNGTAILNFINGTSKALSPDTIKAAATKVGYSPVVVMVKNENLDEFSNLAAAHNEGFILAQKELFEAEANSTASAHKEEVKAAKAALKEAKAELKEIEKAEKAAAKEAAKLEAAAAKLAAKEAKEAEKAAAKIASEAEKAAAAVSAIDAAAPVANAEINIDALVAE